MRPQHVNSLMPRWTAGWRVPGARSTLRAPVAHARARSPRRRGSSRESERARATFPPYAPGGRARLGTARPPVRPLGQPVSHGALELQAGAPAGAPRGRGAAHPREIPRQDPRHRREERQGAGVGWGGRRRVPRGEARSAARACACAYVCVCASLAPSERRGRRAVASGGFTRVHDPDLGARRPPEPARRPQSPSAGVSSSFLGATHPHAVPRALLSGRAADTGWLVGREGWVRRPAGASPAAKHEGVNLRTKERHETKLLVFGSSPRTAAPVRPPRACRTPPGQRAGSHARISTHAAQDAAQSGVGSRGSAWPRPRAFGWRAFLFSLVHPLLAVSSSAPECRKSTSRGLYQQRDIRRPAVGTTKHKTSACTPKTERDPLAPQPTADACPPCLPPCWRS